MVKLAPPVVEKFKEAIAAADGVLIASPEYNYSVPGAFKNAIDWASRPAYHSVFRGKPVATLSAAGSPVGGARGQAALKQVLMGMAADLCPCPELAIGNAAAKLNGATVVNDELDKKLDRFASQTLNFFRTRGAST